MTRNETKQLLILIEALYPTWKVPDPTITTEAWWGVLQDQDFPPLKQALYDYCRNDISGFAPTPGKLLQYSGWKQQQAETLNVEEAVALVRKAVRNGIYHAKEEYDALPAEIQKAVGSPESIRAWAMDNAESFENVILSHFRKQYKQVADRPLLGIATGRAPQLKNPIA